MIASEIAAASTALVCAALVESQARSARLFLGPQRLRLMAEAEAHPGPELRCRVHDGTAPAGAPWPGPILERALRENRTLQVEGADIPPGSATAGCVLCVPLLQRGTAQGWLYLEHRDGRFAPHCVASIEQLAAQAAARLGATDPAPDHEGDDERGLRELREANAALQAEIATLRQVDAGPATDRILLRTVIDNIPDQIFVKDAQSRILIGNRAQAAWIGLSSPEELTGKSDLELYPRQIGQAFFDDEQQLMHRGQMLIDHVELNVNQAGIKRWCYVTKVPLRDEHDNVVGLVGIARDITERLETEEALRLRNRAIELSIDAIVMTDASREGGPIEFVNPAFERLSGYSAEEARGHGVDLLLGPDPDPHGAEEIRSALRERRPGRAEVRYRHRSGGESWTDLYISPVRNGSGEVTHFVWMFHDITEARNYQEQLKHLASYDALTGLPNRRMLMDLLAQSVAFAKRYSQRIAVAFFDLDRFKLINDSLGHGAGDELLIAVAQRVRSCVRRSDTVARLGGDEFVVVLPESSPDRPPPMGPQSSRPGALNLGIVEVLKRIRAAVNEPVRLAGREMRISCSVGVSFFPADGEDAESLLKQADAAMYRAKEKGGDAIELYTLELNAQVSEQLSIEVMLRGALERQEFSLVYQPRVSLASGRVSGVEALLQWHSRERGQVPQAVFLPVLERSGMMNAVGKWMMREAIASLPQWRTRGLTPPRITVNVSQIQLDQKSFVEDVQLALGSCAEPALDLEITESLIMRNAGANIVKLRAIRELGVGIAIDHFGSTHSSLGHLGSLPVSALKIDRAFIDGIATGPEGPRIVAAMVSLAHSMGISAIAEGVETHEQRELLRGLGCDEIQGFLLGPPLPLPAFIEWHAQLEHALGGEMDSAAR